MIYFWSFFYLILGIIINYCCCKDVNYLFYSYVNSTNGNILINASNTLLNPVDVPQWTSQAFYNASQNLTGWDILEVRSNPSIPDEDQAYHAGYIEGYITRDQIWNYYWNNVEEVAANKSDIYNIALTEYYEKNCKYVDSVLSSKDMMNNPYWYQVSLIYRQLHGILDGYNNATKDQHLSDQQITFSHFLFLNFYEEMQDIAVAYVRNQKGKNSTKKVDMHKHKNRHGSQYAGQHCSALIKVLPGNSDVLIAHDTWNSYNAMNRILKRYKLAFKISKNSTELIPGMNTAFSSYPGHIGSVDDFYIMGSGIVAMETTIDIYNESLYRDVHPDQEVGEEVRNIVANRLAKNGDDWMNFFKVNNSGTYNNQWMIVNLNKFKPGFDPEEGFLTVLEQAPGIIESDDQTNHLLQHEYWASYNIPFYPAIYKLTGNEAKAKNDSWFSFSECPRAKIFKKEQPKITNLTSMLWLMRYNRFKKDPYSICEACNPKPNACNAIASRCDLNPPNGNYSDGRTPALFGAVDVKIVSFSLFSKGEFLAVGGPTSDDVPPFIWSKTLMNTTDIRHMGQPDKWDFGPIITSWVLPYPINQDSKSNDEPPSTTPSSKPKKGGVSATVPLSVLVYIMIATLLVVKS